MTAADRDANRADEADALLEELQRAADEHRRILVRQAFLIEMLRAELREVMGDEPERRRRPPPCP
jgi:hypothetical protein